MFGAFEAAVLVLVAAVAVAATIPLASKGQGRIGGDVNFGDLKYIMSHESCHVEPQTGKKSQTFAWAYVFMCKLDSTLWLTNLSLFVVSQNGLSLGLIKFELLFSISCVLFTFTEKYVLENFLIFRKIFREQLYSCPI